MFYSNNNGYMEDLYYYNQMPTATYMNTLGNNMMGNSNMQVMQQGMPGLPNNQIFQNPGMFSGNMPIQNLNNLYPSIYRILNPVVSRVVLNNNQAVTEDLLNNMTDTVFNIVEGQIDLGDDQAQGNNRSDNQTINTNSSSNTLNNTSSSSRTAESARSNNQNIQTSNTRHNRNDSLLRDLIKILIIKELLSRNSFQRQFRK